MKAVILAGGQGTRLKPYTTLLPKALVPLVDMPVLELVLRQLKGYGFTDITLSVGHLAELIEAYFGDGRKWGLEISYVREQEPLGTAGPLRRVPDLPENVLVMNADIISDIDYADLLATHQRQGALATIATYRRTSLINFGVLEFAPETHQIEAFIEKPVLEHSVSMGIYVFNRRIVELIPENKFFGFDHLMKAMLQAEERVQAYPFNGYWLDIGRVDDYEVAVNEFEAMRGRLLPQEATQSPGPAITP